MHAQHALRRGGGGRDAGHRQAAGVGGQQRPWRGGGIQQSKGLALELQVLGDRLDHQLGGGQIFQTVLRSDATHRRVAIRRRELLLLHAPRQEAGHPVACLVHRPRQRGRAAAPRSPARAATWAMPAPIVPGAQHAEARDPAAALSGQRSAAPASRRRRPRPRRGPRCGRPGPAAGPPAPGSPASVRVLGGVDQPLGVADRPGRRRGQAGSRFAGGIHHLGAGQHHVDQAGGMCLGGGQRLTAEDELRGAVAAQGPDQRPGRARVRHQPDADERLDEGRLLGGVDEVAGQRQAHAGAGGHAVDGRDDGLRELADGPDQGVVLALEHRAEVAFAAAAAQVGARAEAAPLAGQDHGPHRIVPRDPLQSGQQLAAHLAVQGVQRLGPVEGQRGNALRHLIADGGGRFGSHGPILATGRRPPCRPCVHHHRRCLDW